MNSLIFFPPSEAQTSSYVWMALSDLFLRNGVLRIPPTYLLESRTWWGARRRRSMTCDNNTEHLYRGLDSKELHRSTKNIISTPQSRLQMMATTTNILIVTTKRQKQNKKILGQNYHWNYPKFLIYRNWEMVTIGWFKLPCLGAICYTAIEIEGTIQQLLTVLLTNI